MALHGNGKWYPRSGRQAGKAATSSVSRGSNGSCDFFASTAHTTCVCYWVEDRLGVRERSRLRVEWKARPTHRNLRRGIATA